jgi:hypothetical protein
MMDRLFDPLFFEPSRDFVTVFWIEEPHQAPQFLIDSVAAKAAQARQPEEIPQLANDLQKYGNELLLRHDENSFQYRMARRLTELDATTIQNNVNLPFGYTKNRCLRQALANGKLSRGCAASIQEMQKTYTLESQLEKRQDVFMALMWVYIAALSVLLLQLARRMRSQRSKRHLRMRILQAVYNNHEIKRQVEDDLGHSVGNDPPLSLHALSLIGRGGEDLKDALRCMKRVHMVMLVVMVVLILVAPFWVLPFCIVVSIVRVVELCLLPNNTVESECACCCCGATSGNADYVLLQDDECCACCKGTGVCSPSCADCCGPKSLDNSCETRCCSKGMVTQECNCCCCGASPSQARDGTLTVEQCCCNCCKGTGVCCAACAACCGKGGCCSSKEGTCETSNDCTCCCCGATPSQVHDGTLTMDQVCCSCCKGTGSCSAACAACCGNDCCSSSKEGICETSDDCTCCCCGATPSQAHDGILTVEQVCCNCCKGTGACSTACANCCGGGLDNVERCAPKWQGQKHVVPVKNEIYCGVPLQVV